MSEAQKSFAERYASKKTTFTSEKIDQKPSETSDSSATQKANSKPIDPQKKMQAELIYLVKGVDAGRNAWYYVLVDRLKVQLLS